MTTAVDSPVRRGIELARSAWAQTRVIERVCYTIAAVLALSGLFHLGVFAVRGGPWEGPVSWRKPTTFGLSFGLTLVAVTWVSSYLRIGPRLRTLLLVVFAADCGAEVAGITVQAWRHVPSHFNMETPGNTAISMMLALGGGILIAVLVIFAAAAFRGDPDLPPSMQIALRAGFVTMLIGLVSGAAMIARGVTLVNTGHQQLAYEVAGFLKPVHAVSLHGVLILPGLAWLLARTHWSEARRTRAVALGVAAYALAIAVALALSLTG
jgi:hypothetical protein